MAFVDPTDAQEYRSRYYERQQERQQQRLQQRQQQQEQPDDNRGTYRQQMACYDDAFKHCRDAIPNIPQVKICMRAKKRLLTPDCRAAVEGRLR